MPGPDIFLAMLVSLLGVLPTLVNISNIKESSKVLKHLCTKQKRKMNKLLRGISSIKFKVSKITTTRDLMMTNTTMNNGKNLTP